MPANAQNRPPARRRGTQKGNARSLRGTDELTAPYAPAHRGKPDAYCKPCRDQVPIYEKTRRSLRHAPAGAAESPSLGISSPTVFQMMLSVLYLWSRIHS
jgi:hypothetical protein